MATACSVRAKGDWSYISAAADGSAFNKCKIMYGGSANPYHGTLEVNSFGGKRAISITNCVFAHNQGGTLSDNRGAALNLGGAGAGSIFTGNTFYDNDMPMVINGLLNIDNTNVFHSGTITNTYNGIFMDGVNHEVVGNVTWSNTDVPFVINNNAVLAIEDSNNVSPGTLTLGNNVILKLGGGRIDILQYGKLTQGTGNYFTSLNDDSRLGDTAGVSFDSR